MTDFSNPLQRLLTRPLAVTTIATSDFSNATKINRASFFRWGIGPSLLRGSIVAMYVPENAKQLEERERGCIRYLFSVVRDTVPADDEFGWNNVVFLNNCCELANPILSEDLQKPSFSGQWPLVRTRFKGAGRLRNPLTYAEAKAFWKLVLRKNSSDCERIAQQLILPTDTALRKLGSRKFTFDVGLSYASEDDGLASKITVALEKQGISVFKDTLQSQDLAGKDLVSELPMIFQSRSRFFLPLISSHYTRKCWTSYEAQLAFARSLVESNGFIVPVTIDGSEIPRLGGNVVYIDLRRQPINELVSTLVKKLG